jgi:hypothetical protein
MARGLTPHRLILLAQRPDTDQDAIVGELWDVDGLQLQDIRRGVAIAVRLSRTSRSWWTTGR